MPSRPFIRQFFIRRCLQAAILLLLLPSSYGQNITRAEYFFDTDPGIGSGIALTVVPGDPVTIVETINTTGIEPGFHILFVRTRSQDGRWSLSEPQEFEIAPAIEVTEYFFDNDPGVGMGTPVASPTPADFTESISTAGLSPGYHTLYIRSRSFDGRWSAAQARGFVIDAIVAAEYFIDADPGFGMGTPLTFTPGQTSINITLTAPSLPDGDHYLFVRTRHESGPWSLYEAQLFTVDTALPIELLSFTAKLQGSNLVLVEWSTATEVNNDYFEVQHSGADLEFGEFARRKGAGMSVIPTAYEALHTDPQPGLNYYRLRQVDFDKSSSYSDVVAVDVSPVPTAIAFPNPAEDEFMVTLNGTGNPGIAGIELLDLQGRACIRKSAHSEAKVKVLRGGLSPGTYVLRIKSSEGEVYVTKLVLH